MKKTNYFSHDSNSRNDEKLLAVRMRLGAEGYGVYFMLLERLREESDYMSIKDYNMIAFDLRVDSKTIKSVVEEFGLFVFTDDGKYFYSESFNSRMKLKDESKQKRSEAGKKGMKSRWKSEKDNNVINTDNNDITKDKKNITSKVKESKVKEIISTDVDIPESEKQASRTQIDYKKLIEFFNSETKGVFGEVRYPLSSKRQDSIRARIREHGKEAFAEMIKKASNSDFLKGNNSTGFQATFDWLIKPTNFPKVLEGNYDNRSKENKETKRNNADADRLEWLARKAEEAFGS
ncbi:Lin1244/Lin1753 domain-containing protein [Petrimonas sp.]|uniref:Lin1244/Lin1753 domain-containing protein n=1 Tax=Petrimonas sp. TaxID=2023866 RepID=UPI003319A2A2